MNRVLGKLIFMIIISAFFCGCSTPLRVATNSGAKLPMKLAIKFIIDEKGKSAVDEKAKSALNEKIRPSILKALGLGFVSVTEIEALPPYQEISLKENDIDGIILLNLVSVEQWAPVVVQLEGFSVTYKCKISMFDGKGLLMQELPVSGNAGFRSPVISGFNIKAKLDKLGDEAANNLSAEVFDKAYNA